MRRGIQKEGEQNEGRDRQREGETEPGGERRISL